MSRQHLRLSTGFTSLILFGSRKQTKNDYLKRAVGAAMGLYGNSQEEAWYRGFVGDGNTLGTMHFHRDNLPPAKFLWSFTLYTLPKRYLYDNEKKRYSIGVRTPNLQYSNDGSLTIYIGHASPGTDKESNWLPAPASKIFIDCSSVWSPGRGSGWIVDLACFTNTMSAFGEEYMDAVHNSVAELRKVNV